MRWRRKRQPLRCLYCDRPYVEWPRFFSDAFYDEHKCPSGRGHAYASDLQAVRCIVAAARMR